MTSQAFAGALLAAGLPRRGEERGHTTQAHPDAATKAIRDIVASVNKSPTMVRVVYTSSIAAMVHESDLSLLEKRPVIWDGRVPGEQFTSEAYKSNTAANGYAIAKILSEQAVIAAAAASSGIWDAVIANPGDNYGPLLARSALAPARPLGVGGAP